MKVFSATSVEPVPATATEGVMVRWIIADNVNAPTFSMRIIEVQPGAATEKHSHNWEHEVYVLEGSGVVKDATSTFPLQPGTCVYVAPNELHEFTNTGASILRFICVIPRL